MRLRARVKSADFTRKGSAALRALACARTLRSAQSIFSYDAVPLRLRARVKSADFTRKGFAALRALAYARTLRSAQSIFSEDAVPGKNDFNLFRG